MIKIGLLLPTREAAINGDRQVSRIIDFARRAEALGLDSVWAARHFVIRVGSLDALPHLEPVARIADAVRKTAGTVSAR
ncbi:hypothetical protein [Actinoallomurus sp. CA-150999]|uniref:hypothetical protein n=1 Tax=Actinoallomurus sp. CA-150999 TaxID=3239887 RepID=UPI003D938B6A